MEELFSQRFNGATIELFKDYCFLNERTRNTFDFDSIEDFFSEKITKKQSQQYRSLKPKPTKGRKINFYYGNESVNENLKFKTSGFLYTTKDKHIKKHYANPYAYMTLTTHERSIRKHGDVITIKIYSHYKTRDFNQKYFRKRTNVTSVSFNTVTGNFTTLKMMKNGGANGNSFKRNSFRELYNVIHTICGDYQIGDKLGLNTDDTIDFVKAMNDAFGFVFIESAKDINFYKDLFCSNFTELFAKTKTIKVPNNFTHYIQFYYPTEKFLKKNDRKLVASILDRFKMKSKYTIKLLHENPFINLNMLSIICVYLGEDFSKYLPNVNCQKFTLTKHQRIDSYQSNLSYFNTHGISNYKLTDIEKENLCHLINDEHFPMNDSNFILLKDHFDMIDKLNFYDDSIIMKSTNERDFMKEHQWLSSQIQFIKKGYEISYFFSEKMLKEIEKPYKIEINGDEIGMEGETITGTFYPFVLKTERDYKEEGTFMHHCVASYSDKSKSVIISIRTKDKSDRVTCEFDTQTGNLLQARHFNNQTPPADMAMVIDMLKPVTKKLARLGLLNSIEKKKIPIVYNGKQVEIDRREVILNEHLFIPF